MNKPSSNIPFPPNDATNPAGYERDFVLWIGTQVELLRARRFELLDVDNIIEELDAMGKSQRREMRSRLKILMMHLLKCQFQPESKSSSWLGTIDEQRFEILGLLEQSPSLRREVEERADAAYPFAVQAAADETALPVSAFPATNPYSVDQMLDSRFLP